MMRDSLDALRAASDISWYSDSDTLWVKRTVSNGAGQTGQIGTPGLSVGNVGPGPGGAYLDVSRQAPVDTALPDDGATRE